MISEIPKPENVQYVSVYRDKKLRYIDYEMSNTINDIFNSHYDEFNRKIGYTSFDLKINLDNSREISNQICRSEENSLCDLTIDAIRLIGKGDICLINAGSFRTDIMTGDIIFRNILDILPFPADIIVKEVSGQDILDALEFGVKDLPKKSPRFLQVSGINFKVNLSIKSTVVVDEEEVFVRVEGKRRVYDVFVGVEKLDIDKKYRISFDNYIGNGADGYSMFNKYGELLSLLKTDNEALKIYIEDELNGTIPEYYNNTHGRIIIHSANSNSSFFLKFSTIIPSILLYIILF